MSRVAILVGVPVVVVTLVGVPLGLWRGPYQWLCAAIALGLTVVPGVGTLLVADRMSKGAAYEQVAALFIGTFVRLVVGFGGAAIVFIAARDTFRPDPVSFWAWVLGAYLLTLTTETVLLGRQIGGRGSGVRSQ